jgi:Raf kinase inhibitor-like YbhB/YbcL family protein
MFTLKSNGFQDGKIDIKYGKHSGDLYKSFPVLSFPLSWDAPPERTETFSIVVQDFDSYPVSGFSVVHWLIADIPVSVNHLPENASRENPDIIQGSNSLISRFLDDHGPDLTQHYLGPGPRDGVHEYEITIYALDAVLGLKKGFYLNDLMRGMRGHILDTARLYGFYGL